MTLPAKWILPACATLAVSLLGLVSGSTAGELVGVAVVRPAEFQAAPKAGDPLVGVGVSLVLNGLAGDDSRAVATARTGPNGEAVFSRLRAGSYTITVTPVNDPPSAKVNTIGGVIIISGTPPQRLITSFSWTKGRKSQATDEAGRPTRLLVGTNGGIWVRLSIFDRWGNQ